MFVGSGECPGESSEWCNSSCCPILELKFGRSRSTVWTSLSPGAQKCGQCVGLLETLVFVYKRVVFPFAFSTCWLGLTFFRGVIIRETVETKTMFLYFINSLGNCHCQKLRTFPDIVFFFVDGTFVYLLWAVLLRRALICIWFESSLIWCFVFVSVVDIIVMRKLFAGWAKVCYGFALL